jgi:hypothetical protein
MANSSVPAWRTTRICCSYIRIFAGVREIKIIITIINAVRPLIIVVHKPDSLPSFLGDVRRFIRSSTATDEVGSPVTSAAITSGLRVCALADDLAHELHEGVDVDVMEKMCAGMNLLIANLQT